MEPGGNSNTALDHQCSIVGFGFGRDYEMTTAADQSILAIDTKVRDGVRIRPVVGQLYQLKSEPVQRIRPILVRLPVICFDNRRNI